MKVYTSFLFGGRYSEWLQFFCFSVLSVWVCLHDGLDLMSLSVPSLYPLLFFLAFQIWEMFLLLLLSFSSFLYEPKPDGEKSVVSTYLPSNHNALSLSTVKFAHISGLRPQLKKTVVQT